MNIRVFGFYASDSIQNHDTFIAVRADGLDKGINIYGTRANTNIIQFFANICWVGIYNLTYENFVSYRNNFCLQIGLFFIKLSNKYS